ncbi:NAD(P)H-binding protein [Bdellovibrio bacteriovorus]|uniref:NAD(P)H-binding protein n=1 Tax=Bdellovibrio bacteriovorus TaxID=959 RepID=UPI0035A57A29
MKVAIAGASGFVGQALIAELEKNHEIVALSRGKKKSEKIEWRFCDLFSLLDAERGLQGVDVGIYLVHSMRPSARLTQGTFNDFDLIVADNFVRAAERCQLKQIIFLGGLHPEEAQGLSRHLRSRWEVEDVFKKSKVPYTIFRAAIILGGEGSSFHIMTRLVERLPVMLCPRWTNTKSQPVALHDVTASIAHVVGNSEAFEKVYDIGCSQPVTYKEMMKKIARLLGKKRLFIPFPFMSPQLSTLWVCMITKAPKELVKPLVRGLKTELLLNPQNKITVPEKNFLSIDEAVKEALQNYDPQQTPTAFREAKKEGRVVRSVQRLPLPKGKTAEDVAQAYMEFLPKMNPGFMKVEVRGRWIHFCLRLPFVPLLVLEYSPERSWSHRQLFYVRGGLLARKTERGRLEFREILGGEAVIAAIHDFEPRLPWYFYRWTQALVHVFVMKNFGLYLRRKTAFNSEARR